MNGLGDIEDIAGAVDVGAVQRSRVDQITAGVDDAIVDIVATSHGLGQGGVVPDIADEAVGVEIVDTDGVGALAHHRPDVVAGRHQLAGDVRTQEAVGADDEFRSAHRAAPFLRIHAAAASSRVPSSCAFLHHFMPADRKRNGL